ncbi:alkanesulfonate monooxygenase SsuD/methylene tetrahydromethanopterin reductase-like flavin-dependent oxidoreductase (luciferase family)/FAD/FMN-containing dehydrogenase [Catenulispora sp. GAS73]|uniref:LLM class flavin-dependent oxidoreductase n=1 Tax=Catenulispora sp. GAS73 TaxID=3156269 RepID=UPI003518DED5
MTDYGHDLRFGTFITPQNRDPQAPVALAQLSEQAGLDLATFQDHPYQPAFLDTWTLLSWVAARTERIHLAANVHSLPMRPPAVLARSAASLDLLSGGRYDMALGAGGFWDAIAAMGGPRRTPGEAVQALSEAIDIMRAIWDPAERGGVRVDGEQYQVVGAKRGPAPAHDIPIWIGALKPRMLRLIGEKADGWLPSLFYLQDGDLERGQRLIDEAAVAAGRDPREIRRLLNISGSFALQGQGFLQGPPEQWAQELLPLAVESGVSTFILASDDPRDIQTYAEEVAPRLRELVRASRQAAGTADGEVVRSPKALELRRSGIAYDAVPVSLRRSAVEPGDKEYERVRSTYVRSGSPGLVLRPDSAQAVADALGFAREQGVPLAIRSGGHSMAGLSTNDGGVVVSLARLKRVEVLDAAAGLVRVEAGARWSQVAEVLRPHGLAISSGDYGGVGVGGLATAGGIGFLGREHGLTIDHVVAAEVVLADGTMVRADAGRHPELFWAVRGAGAALGVVTAFEFAARPVSDVVFGRFVYDGGRDLAGVLERWGEVVESAPRALTSFLYAGSGGGQVQVMAVFDGADDAEAIAALTPLLDVGPVVGQSAQRVPYAAIVHADDAPYEGGSVRGPLLSNGFAEHLTPALTREVADALRGGVTQWLSIRAVGGAVNDIAASATAFAHRHQNFSVADIGRRESEYLAYWDRMRELTEGLYINFETDTRPERLVDAFPGEALGRLRRVKAEYDPEDVFDQAIALGAVGVDQAGIR